MVNVENLRVGAERTTDGELEQRFTNISEEIENIGSDSVEIDNSTLNGQFAEFLLRPENKDALKKLKKDVDKLKNGDWERLGSRAGKGLEDLATFLDDITDENRMKKDYDEFMDRLRNNPKRLSRMKSWEIRRLNLYLGMHPKEAKDAYVLMKNLPENWANSSQDTMFYDSVWGTLKNNYANDPDFMVLDYRVIKDLQPTVVSLRALAGENWDGKTESINIPESKNSIVNVNKVKEIVDEKNKERIDNNKEVVETIDVTVSDEIIGNFTKKDGELKYQGDVFTVEKMMQLFGEQIKESASSGTEFVSETERDNMISEDGCKEAIFNNLRTQLLDDDRVTVEQEQDANGGDESSEGNETPVERTYEESKDKFKIKMPALKDKIKEKGFFDGNEDGDKIKFNIEKVKLYLETLKDRSWSDLERPADPVDRGLWTIAVQIALNYLAQRDNRPEYNVVYIDGIREDKTKNGVIGFQRQNDLKFGRSQQPDGLPGKVTIGKILDVLGEGANSNSDLAGDQAPASGDQAPASGDQAPASGDQAPASGDQAPASGD